MKLRGILQIALVLALAGMTLSATVLAGVQIRTPGVEVGDSFRYEDIKFTWSSNDPDWTPYPYMTDWNEYEWIFVIVTGVSGTVVTGETTTHFKNGTEKTSGGYVDVDTGEGENMTIFVIAANLEPGDPIYTSGTYATWLINETIWRQYDYGARETNHINQTMEQSGSGSYLKTSMNYYWDKPTGILVEAYMAFSNETGQYLTEWSLRVRITESSVWVVPEFPTWTSTLLVFIVLPIIIVIYKRRLTKTPIQ